MRKTLTTAALLLALNCPIFAGEMHTPPAPAPTPVSVTQEMTDGVTPQGEMPNDGTDSLTQTVLELLAVLPAIF